MDGAVSGGGAYRPGGPGAQWLSPPVQFRLALLSVVLVALLDVVVAVQAHRWFKRSAHVLALKWARLAGIVLLAANVVHIALLSLRLDCLLDRFVLDGTDEVVQLGPEFSDQRFELNAMLMLILIGGTVQTGFTWRGYQITQMVAMKALLGFFCAATCAAATITFTLYTLALVHEGTIISWPSHLVTIAFTWLCVGQNVALAWVFYKELIVDRRQIAAHDERDPVTEFAVEALAHQAPLIGVTLIAGVAASIFTVLGLGIHQLVIQLYAPVCLLSALTALLSHDEFRQRYHSSQELTESPATVPSVGVKRLALTRRATSEIASLFRGDKSHAHTHTPGHARGQIKVEQITSCVVEEESEMGCFSFDLAAFEKVRPQGRRRPAAFGEHLATSPAALPRPDTAKLDESEEDRPAEV